MAIPMSYDPKQQRAWRKKNKKKRQVYQQEYYPKWREINRVKYNEYGRQWMADKRSADGMPASKGHGQRAAQL